MYLLTKCVLIFKCYNVHRNNGLLSLLHQHMIILCQTRDCSPAY